MKKLEWQDRIMEKIDALCEVFPPIIKNRWRDRLIYNSEKVAAYQNSDIVTEEILWKSVYEVFPLGYEPLILKVKAQEKLKVDKSSTRSKEDMELDALPKNFRPSMLSSQSQESMEPGTEPVKITRWSKDSDASPHIPRGKKIFAVSSSARKGGNTDIIIDELLRACKDKGSIVEKIYPFDLNIKPCTGCRACRKGDVKTICAIKDDMTQLYDKLYKMDGFITGFPIYTGRENGIMANFLDRLDCLFNPHLTQKMPGIKKGLIVCSWMWPNPNAYENVVENMVILLKFHKVVITDVLIVSGTCGKNHGKGVVKHHPNILDTAYHAGIQFLKSL